MTPKQFYTRFLGRSKSQIYGHFLEVYAINFTSLRFAFDSKLQLYGTGNVSVCHF